MKRFALKRITALVLALIMTLSLCPVSAFAAFAGDTWKPPEINGVTIYGGSNPSSGSDPGSVGYQLPYYYDGITIENNTVYVPSRPNQAKTVWLLSTKTLAVDLNNSEGATLTPCADPTTAWGEPVYCLVMPAKDSGLHSVDVTVTNTDGSTTSIPFTFGFEGVYFNDSYFYTAVDSQGYFTFNNRGTCDDMWFERTVDGNNQYFSFNVPFVVGQEKTLYIRPARGDIASMAVTGGSLYDSEVADQTTNLYDFASCNNANYNQSYKLTLTTNVTGNGSIYVTYYDGSGKAVDGADIQFIAQSNTGGNNQGGSNQGSGIPMACGVSFLDSTTQAYDNSVMTWGDQNGAYAYAVCGEEAKTIYLAIPTWDKLSVTKGGVDVTPSPLSDKWTNSDGATCNVYALNVGLPSSVNTEVYTITRSDANDSSKAESLTLTCDFYPTFSSGFEGTAFAMNCGVAMFTKLDNGSLGYNENVWNDYGSATVMSLGKTEQTVYLAAGVNGTVTVDDNALTQIGTWFNPLDNRYSKVYKYTETKQAGDTVVRAITRNDDHPESFNLTFDFTPVFNSSEGFNAFARGVHLFTNKSGSDLSVDDSVVVYGNENETFMYVACGAVGSRTVYLAANQWDTLSVKDANGNTVPLSEVGMWPTQYTDQNGNPFDLTCNVYALEATGNSGIAEYTVTRSWTYQDGSSDFENITLKLDFYPTLTGNLHNANCGVAIFAKKVGNELTFDKGTPVYGYGDSAEVVCIGKTTQTVYLAVGVHDKVSVSDGTNSVPITRVGTWKSTDTMMRGPWSYEVYAMTVNAPAVGTSTSYQVTRTGFDGGNVETFPLKFRSDSLDQHALGMYGVFFFADYDSATNQLFHENAVFSEKNGTVTVTAAGATSKTVYLAFDVNNPYLSVTKQGETTNLLTDTGGQWTDSYNNTYKIYELTVSKGSTNTVTCTLTRDGSSSNPTTFPIVFDFSRRLGNIGMCGIGRVDATLFTGISGDNLTYDGSFAEGSNADGSYLYGVCGDVPQREVYLALNMWDDYEVTDSNDNVVTLIPVDGTWSTQHGSAKVFKMTATNPGSAGVTAEYKITCTSTYWENGVENTRSESAKLIFDFAPTLTGDIEIGAWNVLFFNELTGTSLGVDETPIMQWGDTDGEHIYVLYGETNTTKKVYLATSLSDTLEVKNGMTVVPHTHIGNATFKADDGSDWPCKVYEVSVSAPDTGCATDYTVTRKWTYWENNSIQNMSDSFTLTADFAPTLTGEIEMGVNNVLLFTDLAGTSLSCETPAFADWNEDIGQYLYTIYGDTDEDQKVYLATSLSDELILKNGTDPVAIEYVGNAAFKVDDGSDWLCKVYEVPVTAPGSSKIIEYSGTRKWTYWENNTPTTKEDDFKMMFDFYPILTANLRNMECGVAIFNKLENGVLSGDESITGLRGSAVISCENATFNEVYLAVNIFEELIVNDGQKDLDLDRAGMTTIDNQLFNVYKVKVPTGTDAVTYDVTRAWTWWDDNDTPNDGNDDFQVSDGESFPLTFDFTLSPGEMPPLTVDGVKIYSYCQNGDLGYRVTYVYDELGVNDDTNTVTVPCRPNQDKTIYLASDKPLYLNGVELPKCTNPATEYGKTVYELTAEGVNLGPSTAVVNIGDTGNTITVRFTFHSVMFIGTSFYTTTDENFGGYFTYEDRTTCDGLSIEYLPVPGIEHFYLNVPFAVGQKKVLYINPDHGAIASLAITNGSLEAKYYSLETIEDSRYTNDYGKYYKLTLSDELNEQKNLMFELYDENKEVIGNFDVQFTPIYEAKWGLATGDNLDEMPTSWINGTLAQAMDYANGLTEGTAYIQLLKDMDTAEPLVFDSGKTTILDLNGYTIDRGLSEAIEAVENGNVITVKGNLTLCDTSATAATAPGKITGGYASSGGGVYVYGSDSEPATFTMNGGIITNNTAKAIGGGVCINSYKDVFTMNGGAITDNTSGTYGGGVYADDTFTMNGGTISGNEADMGGGLKCTIFTMNGGTITENVATVGGGVYVNGGLRIAGGTISGNSAEVYGGGVAAGVDTEISGNVTIFGNTANGKANNLHVLVDNTSLCVVSELASAAKIGITRANVDVNNDYAFIYSAGVFTTGGGAYANNFISDNDDFMVVADGSDLMLAVKRTVSFYANNGTDQTAEPFEVADGRRFALPARPQNTISAPDYKRFKGWSYSANGAVITDSIITVTSDIRLYAIWENIPAEAPVVEVSDDLTITYGEYSNQKVSVTVTEEAGYSYTYQWYDADNNAIGGATNDSYVIANDLTAGTYSYYCVVTATREDNSETATATSATITVTVAKATPDVTAPAELTATYGQTLADVQLPTDSDGTWSWKDDTKTSVGNAGDNTFMLVFTPNDLDNYESVEVEATVAVAKKQVAIPEKDTTHFEYDGKVQTYDVAVSDLYTVTGTTRTAAGSHNVTITLKDKANYEWNNDNPTADLVFDFAIARRMITVTADAVTKTFGETDPALTYTVDRLVEGETLKGDLKRVPGEDAGAYAIEQGTLTVANNPNYNITYKEAEFTITKADATVTAPVAQQLTYTGSAQALVSAGSTTGGTMKYALGTDATTAPADGFGESVPMGTVAGTYYVWYFVDGGNNYNDEAAQCVTVTIAKQQVTKPLADDSEFVYNGKEQTYSVLNTNLYTISNNKRTAAGEQTVTVTLDDTANYEWAGGTTAAVEFTFTIAKAAVTVTADNKSKVYGESDPALTYSASGLVGEEKLSDISVTRAGGESAGEYAITVTQADGANSNYAITFVDGTFTIAAKTSTPTIELSAETFTYDGTAKEPTVTVKDGENVIPTSEYTVVYSDNINAGAAKVTITDVAGGNYVVNGSKSFTIAKAPLTITANAKTITYGAAPANAGVSYTGFVNGETEAVLTGALSYNYNYEQYGDVGIYAITPAGLSSDNYEITFVNGTLTVEQKEIGIKWSNTDLTYSGKAQAPTATATGLVNGDEVTLAVSGEQTNASAEAYTATVTAVSNDNYKLPEAVTTQFTIAKAEPSYTIPVGLTATYGQTLADVELPTGWAWVDATQSVGNVGSNKFAVEFTPEDTINYNKVSGTATITVNKQQIAKPDADNTKFVYTGVVQTYTVAASELYTVSNTTRTAAGEQKVTIALTDKANYAWVGGSGADLEYTFTIAKAPLTITANAKSITYGAAPANAGVSYTGFVNGETEAVLTGALNYSYNYKQYGNVGSYAITPAGLSSNNYAITFVNGALTVEQKEIGIEWGNTDLTYSGKAQAPTATATGMVNGDEVTLTVSGEQTNIGFYTATVTGLVGDKAGNYKLPANVTTAFTVDYATVTFNTNGAGTIAPIENLTYGDKITEPSKPEKAKHTFAGWFSDEKCTKLWVFDKDTITGDMTLYAKWSENPVYDVSGIVYEQPGNDGHSQKVANAHVQLMLGTTVVVEQTTNENGQFFFGGQEEGDYNLVVTYRPVNSKHDKVVTVLVALHEHNADDIEVVLPKQVTNSKVEHKNDKGENASENDNSMVAGTLVGGLDAVAETVREQAEKAVDTSSGVDASEVIAKVEVTLTVEDTPPVTNPTTEEEKQVQKEQIAIQQKAPGKEVVFFDLSVLMSVTDKDDKTDTDYIHDTGSLLEIRIPFEKGNKSGITIYRYHGDQAEALPAVNEGSQTEGFWVGDDGYIHIYTHKFSTYAVGYTEPGNTTPSYPGGYYPIVTPTTPVEKPEDTKPEDAKPVVTPTTPVEDDVTPEPEDTTPVVPEAPATDDAPAVDNTPADDITPSDSGNSVGLWIGVALAVLVVAIIVVMILIKRKKA